MIITIIFTISPLCHSVVMYLLKYFEKKNCYPLILDKEKPGFILYSAKNTINFKLMRQNISRLYQVWEIPSNMEQSVSVWCIWTRLHDKSFLINSFFLTFILIFFFFIRSSQFHRLLLLILWGSCLLQMFPYFYLHHENSKESVIFVSIIHI